MSIWSGVECGTRVLCRERPPHKYRMLYTMRTLQNSVSVECVVHRVVSLQNIRSEYSTEKCFCTGWLRVLCRVVTLRFFGDEKRSFNTLHLLCIPPQNYAFLWTHNMECTLRCTLKSKLRPRWHMSNAIFWTIL